MKPLFISLSAFLVLLCACNNKATTFLKPSNLQSSFINIDADSAYTLKTGKGSIITIAAGTFMAEDGHKVNIEIKEAFTMQEILLAGLTTESNGRPLQSGGMLYFNATSNGKPLDMKKPVGISIPSEIYDAGMQLFKGEVKEDSSINWVDPQPLDTTPNAQMILTGEELFKGSCASCHKVFQDFTGPVMAGFSKRMPGKEWLYHFIASPASMINKEPYATYLFNKWKPTVMTAFPSLSKKDIDAIMAYIENEEKLHPEKVPPVPCGYDTLVDRTIFYSSFNTIESFPADTTTNDETLSGGSDTAFFTAPDYVEKDFAIRQGIYSFNIEVNGWYNIDKLLPEDLATVNINAPVTAATEADMRAYLFLPEEKILIQGGLSKQNKVLFYGSDNDNNLRLKKGARAILLVFGSDKKDMYYAISSFILKEKQDIILTAKKTTEEILLQLIRDNSIDSFKIDNYRNDIQIRERPCNDSMPERQPITTADTGK